MTWMETQPESNKEWKATGNELASGKPGALVSGWLYFKYYRKLDNTEHLPSTY